MASRRPVWGREQPGRGREDEVPPLGVYTAPAKQPWQSCKSGGNPPTQAALSKSTALSLRLHPLHAHPHPQVATPCFADPAAAGIDLTGSQLAIPRGSLPASSGTYRIALTVAKHSATQNRSDTDEAVIRVLAVAAPTCRVE